MHVKVGTIQKIHTQLNELVATRVFYVPNEKSLMKLNIKEQMTMFVSSVQIQE